MGYINKKTIKTINTELAYCYDKLEDISSSDVYSEGYKNELCEYYEGRISGITYVLDMIDTHKFKF